MVKLTDANRFVLTAAGARERGLILPLPKSAKLAPSKAQSLIAGLIKDGLIAAVPIEDGDPVWRNDEAQGKLTLVATEAGLKAVGIEPSPSVRAESIAPKAKNRSGAKAAATWRAKVTANAPGISAAPRSGSKLAILIAALESKKGTTVVDMTEATGWQPHSVRGAISGALKKKLGLTIVSSVVEGRGRVYRIVE